MTQKQNDKNTLHLVLKHEWFFLIESNIKKEEYREIKPYYEQRLSKENIKNFDKVCFHRGYTSNTMTFEIISISKGKGKTEWGAPKDREVFIIKLGKRID